MYVTVKDKINKKIGNRHQTFKKEKNFTAFKGQRGNKEKPRNEYILKKCAIFIPIDR
jgi:hypothetical protein